LHLLEGGKMQQENESIGQRCVEKPAMRGRGMRIKNSGIGSTILSR
jgi:hypothetical protein